MTNLVKKKLKIDGMHCSSCAMKIDMDLEDLDGIKEAVTNYAKQETEIEFDQDRLDIGQIIAAVAKTGYVAQVKPD